MVVESAVRCTWVRRSKILCYCSL